MFRYLSLILISGILLVSCTKKPEKTSPKVEDITESVYASGIIKSNNQYQVFASVAGLIQKILVKEGDEVKKGAALVIIQGETSRLSAENAALSAAFAESNTRGEHLNELKLAIQTAQNRMVNDSLLLHRQRELWAQQIGSRVELEQRELNYTASVNNFKAAQSRLRDQQKQLDFAAAQSRKQSSISRNIAGDYVVRSQVDGRVYHISKEVGELVGPQTPIAVVGDAHEFITELQIDENDIVRVKPGQRVLLSMDSYEGQVFEAQIISIDPFMQERSRTFTVQAGFVQAPPTLYPNLSVEANIVIRSKTQALTIPRNYLVGDSVVILENKEKRKVTLGLKDYLKAEILSGLSAGENILMPNQ